MSTLNAARHQALAKYLLALLTDTPSSLAACRLEPERRCRFIASACAQGIVATGDGSKASPYLVTRTDDEYDVAQYLGKEPAGQSLLKDGEESFDLMNCSDGSLLCFDVTDLINHKHMKFKLPES